MNANTKLAAATQADNAVEKKAVSKSAQTSPAKGVASGGAQENLQTKAEGLKPSSKAQNLSKKQKNIDVSEDSELNLSAASSASAVAEPQMGGSLLFAQAVIDTAIVSDAGVGSAAAAASSSATSAVATEAVGSSAVAGAAATTGGFSTLGLIGGVAAVGAAAGGGSGTAVTAATTATAVPVLGTVNPVINSTVKAAGFTVTGTAEAGASVTVKLGSAEKTVTATGGNWSVTFAAADIPADGATSLSAVAKKTGSTDSASSAAVSISVDTVAPTIPESFSADGANKTITLTYSEALDGTHLPAADGFTVLINGDAKSVNVVAVIGNTVVLTMDETFQSKATVSVTYQDSTGADDVAAIQDAAGNDAASFATIVVADGYIRGAQVYIDTNNNGVIDGTDTLLGKTDKNGNILISGNLVGGTLLVQGGVNIDTGVANTTVLKAPKGSTSITPLTTLVQIVVEQQVAANPNTVVDAAVVQTAMAQVASALGLTTALNGKSLTSYDPIAKAKANPQDENAIAVQKAAAQVATIVAMASSIDAANSVDNSAEMIRNLATKISENGSAAAISLTDLTVLNSILPSSLSLSDAQKSEITAASTSISTAADIAAISTAQGQSLDTTAAAKPKIVEAPALTKDPANVSVKVSFEITKTDGTAVIVGDTIQLKEGSVPVGPAAVVTDVDLANGFKEIVVSLVGDGEHTLKAFITDSAGKLGSKLNNVSDDSDGFIVKVDTVVDVPVVADVATDNVVNGAEKTAGVAVSGTAEAGSSVAVTWGATTKKVTATGDKWTANFASTEVPADGNTSVSAVATDVAGNVSVAGTKAFAVDTTVAAPVVAAVTTDNVVNGAEKTAGVAVSGTAEAGAKVDVTWGATTKTVTATGGNWTANFAAREVPADGNTSVSAVATDVAGNVSAAGTKAITVDTAVADPVVAAVATDNVVNSAEKTAGVTVSGTAEAGASVAVTWGEKTKTVTATGGSWTANFASTEVPADGDTSVSAVATDVAGNVSVAGPKNVKVDTVSPTATATIRTVEDNVPSTPVTEIAKNSTTNDNTPTLYGDLTAALGDGEALAVYDGSIRLGEAAVNGTAWNFVSTSMANGAHSLTVAVEDSAGNQGAVSSSYAFTVDATVPAATAAVTALAAAVNTDKPAISGTITGAMASGDVVKVFDGSTLLGNATVSGSAWSFTPSSALSQGQHKITAVVENAGGTQSALSTEKAFAVDTVAPAKPVLTSFSDNSGSDTDNITNDKTVTISMTAEAGSKLEVFSGTTSLGLATESSTAAGTFSFTTDSLADGSYSIKAVSSDAAGNTSTSVVETLVIDATAPAKSVITNWVNTGSAINLVIAAETGSEVTVSKGGVVLGTATETSTKGVYNYSTAIESSGNYGFTTTAKDVAGNVSSSNTQTAMFVSGDSFQTVTPGSLDLKIVSSTATALTVGLYPKFSNTGFANFDTTLLIDSSKVALPTSATTGLSDFTMYVETIDVLNTTIDAFNLSGINGNFDAVPTNVTSAFATFALSWKSSPQVLDIKVDTFIADALNNTTYSGLSNPIFRFTPGNGVVEGTTGDDLIITGTGNVSVTGGAGADTVLLGNSAVNLTLTDFAFGTDKIDVSKLMAGAGYTSTGTTAAANVGVMLTTAPPTDIKTLIANQDVSLDNKFGAWFEAATTGTNKGVLHLFGDTDAAVGAGHIAPNQVDIVIGANSTGTFSLADLVYHLPTPVVI